ncbi:MAG: two-component regulator propeller domain-containing protein, partial [Bacteroidota bacterium]
MNCSDSFTGIITHLLINHISQCLKPIGLSILFFSLPVVVHTQIQLDYQNFTKKQSLGNSAVFSILEDHLGFIWVGHDNGLDRFGGQHLLNFKNEPLNLQSLNHNWVLGLHEDKVHDIWIGTEVGLNKLDRKTGKIQRIPIYEEEKQVKKIIQDIFEDDAGTIWLNELFRKKMYQLVPASDEESGWKVVPFDLDARLNDEYGELLQYSLMHIDASNLWIYTNLGIVEYDYSSDTVVKLIPHLLGDLPMISEFPKAAYSPKGKLYYFIRNNFFSIDIQSELPEVERLNLPKEKADLPDLNATIWFDEFSKMAIIDSGALLFSLDNGLYTWDIEGEKIQIIKSPKELGKDKFDSAVLSFYLDSKGNHWIGTYNDGLYVGKPLDKTFSLYQNDPLNDLSIPKGSVEFLMEDSKGSIWIETLYNGLHRISWNEDGQLEKKVSIILPDDQNELTGIDETTQIIETSDKHFLIASKANGVIVADSSGRVVKKYLNKGSEAYSFASNSITDLALDKEENVWVSTERYGFFKIDNGSGKVTQFTHDANNANSLSNDQIFCVHVDQQGLVWLGTINGLDCYNPKTGRFQHFKNESNNPYSISNGTVHMLFEERQGNLWIVTSEGLNYFDQEIGRFQHFTHDPNDPSSISESIFGSWYEDQKGNIWIGTNAGLYVFDKKKKGFDHFFQKDGLPSNYINNIIEDDNG